MPISPRNKQFLIVGIMIAVIVLGFYLGYLQYQQVSLQSKKVKTASDNHKAAEAELASLKDLNEKMKTRRYSACALGSSWVNPNGNRNVPYLDSNDAKRNLNLNWNDNHWNDNCRFLALRQSFHSFFESDIRRSHLLGAGGFYLARIRSHPPIILPTSAS